MNRTVVIIGGTFNPITTAHVQIGIEVKKQMPDADIVYVPSSLDFISDWKAVQKEDVFAKNRLTYIEKVIQPYNFLVSTIEVDGIVNGTTYDTVQYFKNLGYTKVYICVGFDKIEEMENWSQASKLLHEVEILLITRNHNGKKDITNPFMVKYINKIKELHMPSNMQDISSTNIRNAYKEKDLEKVKFMLNTEIYESLERSLMKL